MRGLPANVASVNGGAGFTELWPDLAALLGFGALWLTLGYLAFVWLERRTRRAGTLGQY